MIKKFMKRIRPSDDIGFFHNSREDVRALSEYCNELADKVDELITEVNRLSAKEKKD